MGRGRHPRGARTFMVIAFEHMNKIHPPDTEATSLLALATMLVERRRFVTRMAFAGAVIAGLSVVTKPQLYTASISFLPQGSDEPRSVLAGTVNQFSAIFPGASPSQSPAFYVELMRSRRLLGRIVRDTFVVSEEGGRHVPFLDLFMVEEPDSARREAYGLKLLKDLAQLDVVTTTGVVVVSVRTRWPSVSKAIVTSLVEGVDAFNQQTRQSQAASERKFLEARLVTAHADLRASEDRLAGFLRANRQYASSVELAFEHDRMQREVALRQQVVASLTQSYEDARIREVRDTPLITIVEPPQLPSVPEPRGRIRTAVAGLLLGTFVGVAIVFFSRLIGRARTSGGSDVDAFFRTVDGLGWGRRVLFRRGRSSHD